LHALPTFLVIEHEFDSTPNVKEVAGLLQRMSPWKC